MTPSTTQGPSLFKPHYPLFTEVDPGGNVVQELLSDDYRSYRASF